MAELLVIPFIPERPLTLAKQQGTHFLFLHAINSKPPIPNRQSKNHPSLRGRRPWQSQLKLQIVNSKLKRPPPQILPQKFHRKPCPDRNSRGHFLLNITSPKPNSKKVTQIVQVIQFNHLPCAAIAAAQVSAVYHLSLQQTLCAREELLTG